MNARLKYFAPSAMLISADSGSGAESLKTMRLCFDAKKIIIKCGGMMDTIYLCQRKADRRASKVNICSLVPNTDLYLSTRMQMLIRCWLTRSRPP